MKNINLILSFVLLAGVSACVEIIDFDPGNPDQNLVIDGKINTSWGPHQLRLSRSTTFGTQFINPETGAEVILYEDGEEVAIFREDKPGLYQIDQNNIRGTSGRSYYIYLMLSNGQRYQSRPETLPPSVDTDTMRTEVVIGEYLNRYGNVLAANFVDVYVRVPIPDREEGPFLRWDLETIWTLPEILCGPLDRTFTCYIPKEVNAQNLLLLDGSNKVSGSVFEMRVTREFLDETYNYRHSFRLFQKSMSKPAFQYWTKVDRVINQVGTIFDAPPAPLAGNVYNTLDVEEEVLGYFEAAAEDTVYTFVTKYTLEGLTLPLISYCGSNLYRPRARECCDCQLLDNSSLIKPDFW